LQTFPDTYTFPVDRRETYQQIGNALPPKMAEEIANSLYE
jgi:DNA (cytosine-5)-methyltransferase 1